MNEMLKRYKLILVSLCISFSMSAQNLRIAYSFYYKTYPTQEAYHVEPDMMLDWSIEKSVFYSDATFHRDSLSAIAFDKNGNISDNISYQKIYDFRGGAMKDIVFIDYFKHKYEVQYRAATVFLTGQGDLAMPRWTLTEETTVTSTGLNVKKGIADYLGRKWIIWYCEDIPVSAGPWLLWGAPGLIVEAHDSEELFHFKLLNVLTLNSELRYEQIASDRHAQIKSGNRHYTYEIGKAEQVHNKIKRDMNYLFQMAGHSTTETTIVDRNGKSTALADNQDYIPLIPDDFWK